MVREATNTEYLLTRKTAEEYRSRGYEVSLETPLDFLPGFQADLIARKGGETKVIEVKSRSSLAAIPQIGELARIVDSKPGWSFELLLVGEPEKLESPEGARSFDGESILRRIKDAEGALESGHGEAAFLLAWSACEAAARELIAAEGVSDIGIATSGHVLNQAVYQGVISRDEYSSLTGLLKYRNAIVHGFNFDDFSDEFVGELIESVRRMTETMTRSVEVPDQPSDL